MSEAPIDQTPIDHTIHQFEALANHTKKQQQSLFQTLGVRISVGFDDFMRAMGFGKQEQKKWIGAYDPHFITPALEKFEEKLAHKRKISL